MIYDVCMQCVQMMYLMREHETCKLCICCDLPSYQLCELLYLRNNVIDYALV